GQKEGSMSISGKIAGAKIWGLTGGIASGKSTAARAFEKAGFYIIDADQLARDLSLPGSPAFDEIVKIFGTYERDKIREQTFSQPQKRQALEALLHPLIRKKSQELIAKKLTQSKSPLFVLYEAALLVETRGYQNFEGLIVVE